MQRLKGQVAIVTGASSGIGRACAIALAAAGASVMVNHPIEKTLSDAEKVVGEITAGGGVAVAVQADVSKEDQVQAMFRSTIDRFGTVDILINNAGLQRDAAFVEMTLEQ